MTSPLGESELATLTELAETFVPGDAARRARLAADALAVVAIPRNSTRSAWSCG